MNFDFAELSTADRYKLMSAAITPRPIAWLTTISEDGVRNAAPYSFFNMMGSEPPIVAVGLMRRPDGQFKDSAANILETWEFVVNLVSKADAAAMNQSCIDAPAEFDEIDAFGISTAPSLAIAPPRISTAPVAMECKLLHHYEAGLSTVAIGQVLQFHVQDELIDPDKLYLDTLAMNLVARMHGGGWYTRSTDLFQLDRPSYEDWLKNNG